MSVVELSCSQPPTPTTPSSSIPASVMKVKAIGSRKEGPILTEAEALRKDPFKNYDASEKPVDED